MGLALLLPAPGSAATYPQPSGVDRRLRYTTYHPDQVYVVQAAVGRALFIQFAQGEEMERFYTGDSEAWEVGKHANLVAIKPTVETPDTNLIIFTTAGRVYTFELSLNERAPVYGLRFAYPNEEHQADETRRAKERLDEGEHAI
jgi:type IV secretion system protein VirB9